MPQSSGAKPAAKAPARLQTQAEQFSLEQLIKSGNRLPVAYGQARASLPKATLKPSAKQHKERQLAHSSDSNELDPLLQPPSAEQHIETEVAEQYTVTKKVQSAKHSKAGSTSEESPDAARLRLEAAERAAAKEKVAQAERDKAAKAELQQQSKAEKAAQRQRNRQAKQAAAKPTSKATAAKPALMAAIATPLATQKAAAKPAAPTSVKSAAAVTPAASKESATKPTDSAVAVVKDEVLDITATAR